MASATPANGDQERMERTQSRKYQPTVDELAGAASIADIVLGAAVIAMGLFAGLFYTFTTAVMPGLSAADDRTLVDAMQKMIENPVFPLTFLGSGVLAGIALYQARRDGARKCARWIVASLVFYAVTVVITFVIHLPLNDDLMNAGNPDQISNLAKVRDDFIAPWVAWDFVRTLASTAAFGCLAWASILRGRPHS